MKLQRHENTNARHTHFRPSFERNMSPDRKSDFIHLKTFNSHLSPQLRQYCFPIMPDSIGYDFD